CCQLGWKSHPIIIMCEDSFLPSVFDPQTKTTGSNRAFALIQSRSRAFRDLGFHRRIKHGIFLESEKCRVREAECIMSVETKKLPAGPKAGN
ncbi:MAG: hypothetical protein WCA13_00295, partial [Terriglobales bacterium]